MNRKSKLTPADKSDIIACIIAFILIPIIGPFIYLFIADCSASSERKLALLQSLDAETQKARELSAKLENTLTTIKHIKQKIAVYENQSKHGALVPNP
ncbi:MAG: hypothetical protein IKJ29_07055 [Akkermansia sp.]|nr:hypothetical protein [Akkermansia sp.]